MLAWAASAVKVMVAVGRRRQQCAQGVGCGCWQGVYWALQHRVGMNQESGNAFTTVCLTQPALRSPPAGHVLGRVQEYKCEWRNNCFSLSHVS